MSRLMPCYPLVSFSYHHYQVQLLVKYLICCTNCLIVFAIAFVFISFHDLRKVFNSTKTICVNFAFLNILFLLIKTRTKPDGNGGLAEVDTPKREMKMKPS